MNKTSQGKAALPPVKVAILVDGGFFVKRFNSLMNRARTMTGADVADYLYTIAHKHVGNGNMLYRIFYYDCHPFDKKMHNPINKHVVDFKSTPEYKFRVELLESLKKKRKVALRLGTLKESKTWGIHSEKLRQLLNGEIEAKDLQPEDVYVELRQKGIDMKIGVDIASLAMKRFVDRIVLISGDSDFVPAAKLARREGVDFILDPMWANVEQSLFEHIDGLESFVKKPKFAKNRKQSEKTK